MVILSRLNFRKIHNSNKLRVKFPHSPILHYAFSSWIEKTMTKTMDRKKTDNNKKKNRKLGKQICFTIVWGCAEILPNFKTFLDKVLGNVKFS